MIAQAAVTSVGFGLFALTGTGYRPGMTDRIETLREEIASALTLSLIHI